VYAESYVFEINDLSPQLAVPHSVDNVRPIETVQPVKINQGFIGTCTGGRVEDIAAAAEILKGKKIPQYVRLVVIPASKEVMRECMDKGYIQALIDAGATISTPGCGPCLGAHEGVLAPGEVCITASNRNFPGRMGSTGAEIYLASPATVAVSVLNGYITDPRTLYK
ncbi:MAG TPA: 3-isopropylmalate dehydratase large subunit, partial [Firmicutes bacterium]|nr:3-isopropylmalate dehydratase large subunit [Bacillota bacterium]